ncbi:type VI secretion system tube protein Hcp [Marinomonas aquiplantarum]|uniref:Type VI secretion system secreted protein Hcp n=1 Tax=Marinomonas aquiplantarum TaxID=491951 RepID=A0A366CW92_9GAMM|nr:type VI secretion system tube protein Hcp [Marinomonas aquiplantarum]RBO81895.1 type VI secretion system secreted protein Hcp [Marinomonas aquiplantarum]
MDLILMQFGVDGITSGQPNADGTGIGTMIDGEAGEPNWLGVTAKFGSLTFQGDKCIELVSINQGIKQQVTTDVSNNARTSGRPVITDFTCVKYTDYTSPKMYDYCLRALTLDNVNDAPTILWVLRNSGDQLNAIMAIELRLTLISEIHFQSHPNDMPTEQFKLNFTEIGWLHQVQGASVNNGGFSATAWSIAKNRPIPAAGN